MVSRFRGIVPRSKARSRRNHDETPFRATIVLAAFALAAPNQALFADEEEGWKDDTPNDRR